jgi:hypothetical protein
MNIRKVDPTILKVCDMLAELTIKKGCPQSSDDIYSYLSDAIGAFETEDTKVPEALFKVWHLMEGDV